MGHPPMVYHERPGTLRKRVVFPEKAYGSPPRRATDAREGLRALMLSYGPAGGIPSMGGEG